MKNAREIAIKVLYDVHEKGAYANVALIKAFRKYSLTELDRRFTTELVYGVVKAGDTINWILKKYISRPMNKVSPFIREILFIGIFQIFFLDKIPHSAACNESVNLAKKYGHVGSAKFVNAVLRAAIRNPDRAKFPTEEENLLESLYLTLQHPKWLIKKWLSEFGKDNTKKLCKFNNLPAPLSIRTNSLKITRSELLKKLSSENVEAIPSSILDEGIICIKYPFLDSLNSLKEGFFQVQDESSMLVAKVLSPIPGEFIIDACSAPGGKTTHIAELMQNKGKILAFDIYEHKLKRINENATRLGINIIETKCMDARMLAQEKKLKADRVLVDAPCSGLGVLRRKPDARWRKTEQELKSLPSLQLEILSAASKTVKNGGILVYSTCTIEETENTNVINTFLEMNPDFYLEDISSIFPNMLTKNGMLQLYPYDINIDGFFIARMKRKED